MEVCTSLQTDNHTSTSPLSFFQAGYPSCRPTNSVKALKALCIKKIKLRKSGKAIKTKTVGGEPSGVGSDLLQTETECLRNSELFVHVVLSRVC